MGVGAGTFAGAGVAGGALGVGGVGGGGGTVVFATGFDGEVFEPPFDVFVAIVNVLLWP